MPEKKDLFDIIAGTSVGGINAVLIRNVVNRNKTWEQYCLI